MCFRSGIDVGGTSGSPDALRLIKRYRVETIEPSANKPRVVKAQIELYVDDSQAAVKTLMEYHGLLTDNFELRTSERTPPNCVSSLST